MEESVEPRLHPNRDIQSKRKRIKTKILTGGVVDDMPVKRCVNSGRNACVHSVTRRGFKDFFRKRLVANLTVRIEPRFRTEADTMSDFADVISHDPDFDSERIVFMTILRLYHHPNFSAGR
jgi:hypothetical protein